jgi:hyaluronan synthase
MRSTAFAFPWTQGKWRSLEEHRIQVLDLALKILVPLILSVCFLVALKVGSFNGYLQLLSSKSYGSPLMALGAGFTLTYLAFQLVRTIFWWRYKSYPLPQGPLPRVTVIIPAYNEGALVEKAIYAAAASDYPADRLEIICIDDGSKDDTWTYIDRAQKRYPKLIKAIRFPRNRGKKKGLYAGFTQGKGEFFVTIDSDSIIRPDTVRQVIAPMLQDPQIGAVAGNVKVFNRVRCVLARMLAVRFVLAFDFLRASQSMYGCVTCTPGALSAYRARALKPILKEWRHQTFLGLPANIGEDRALTNLVLRQGYFTVYQRSALVYTKVPETYRGLVRMYLRWDRSNFRENWVQLKFIFSNYRKKHWLLPIIDFSITQIEFPFTYLFLGMLLVSFVIYPIVMVKFFAGLGVFTLIWLSYYISQERDLEFIYGIIYSYFAFFFLNWVQPWAFLTVRNDRWLTR